MSDEIVVWPRNWNEALPVASREWPRDRTCFLMADMAALAFAQPACGFMYPAVFSGRLPLVQPSTCSTSFDVRRRIGSRPEFPDPCAAAPRARRSVFSDVLFR